MELGKSQIIWKAVNCATERYIYILGLKSNIMLISDKKNDEGAQQLDTKLSITNIKYWLILKDQYIYKKIHEC